MVESFIDLSDNLLLLALCIREDELDDPTAWCADFRRLHQEIESGPQTSYEAHTMMARSDALFNRLKQKMASGD